MSTAGTIIRVLNATGTACCPCPDQTDCSCSSFPTSLSCQYKGGIAQLCGFEEFTSPSSPPKKYRVKETTTVTPMTVCETYSASDCPSIPCPGNVFPAGVVDSGGCGLISMGGSLVMVADLGGGLYSYEATCHAAEVPSGTPQGCQVRVGYSNCVQSQFNDGETKTLSSACLDAGAVIWSPFCGTNPQTTVKCMTVGGPSIDVVEDTWDLSTEYGETTCSISQVDNSERLPGLGSECPPTSYGDPEAVPCDNVEDCYGGGVEVTAETSTQRTYEGVGCVLTAPSTYKNFAGELVDTLSEEDTFYNAVVRADLPQSWTAASSCIETPAFGTPQSADFSFGYRSVQVRATITNLTIGLNYKTTIRFYRRACCGSGDFAFYGSQEINFTATATTETTIWIELNNTDSGYETVAANAGTVSVP